MSRRADPSAADLNLAPILNIVMILIPLLLLTASFVTVASIDIEQPRERVADLPVQDVRTPRVLITVGNDGFRVADLSSLVEFTEQGFATPIELELTGHSATTAGFRELYNRLVAIRDSASWRLHWTDHNILFSAEPTVSAERLVRAMDIARYRLEEAEYRDNEAFTRATWRLEAGAPVPLFSEAGLVPTAPAIPEASH